jgi:hypothetical protein
MNAEEIILLSNSSHMLIKDLVLSTIRTCSRGVGNGKGEDAKKSAGKRFCPAAPVILGIPLITKKDCLETKGCTQV